MPQEQSLGIVIHSNKQFLLLLSRSGHWTFLKGNYNTIEDKEIIARKIALEKIRITTLFFSKDFKSTSDYFYMQNGKIIHKDVEFMLAETNEKLTFLSTEDYVEAKWLNFEEALSTLKFTSLKNTLIETNNFLKYH